MLLLLFLSPLFTLRKRWRSQGMRLGMEEGETKGWRRVKARTVEEVEAEGGTEEAWVVLEKRERMIGEKAGATRVAQEGLEGRGVAKIGGRGRRREVYGIFQRHMANTRERDINNDNVCVFLCVFLCVCMLTHISI